MITNMVFWIGCNAQITGLLDRVEYIQNGLLHGLESIQNVTSDWADTHMKSLGVVFGM